ncbi:MAG: hypothetical protein JW682_04225 [Campylobacterales bacterium]|nr:hypothetical protein [Campylobacterales bacterium]
MQKPIVSPEERKHNFLLQRRGKRTALLQMKPSEVLPRERRRGEINA